jgi:protein involved in polysaccharide export with SLBB domain
MQFHFPLDHRRLKFRLRLSGYALALALVAGAYGCATEQIAPAAVSAAQTSAVSSPDQPSQAAETSDVQRLQELWQKRTRDSFGSDFTLGPGDVLEIEVPLEQLEHREVRVSPRDTITLPLAGVVQVKGMTEQSLTDSLRRRLSKYMYDPPVSLFVKQYGSRQVAVMGAIEKPGLYTLASGSDTLMEMISKAGGMTGDAASKIIFVPAGAGGSGLQQANLAGVTRAADPDEATADTDAQALDADTSRISAEPVAPRVARVENEKAGAVRPGVVDAPNPHTQLGRFGPVAAKLHPIIIGMSDPSTQNYLELPARPGDVLIVPSAGEVTVGGWVQQPGAYKVTPGMTALSAISAAGGAMFSSSAEVLRTGNRGERLSIAVNIPAVQKGQESDVSMQSGDVVMVDKSAAGAIPYAAYEVFSKFGSGLMFPIP